MMTILSNNISSQMNRAWEVVSQLNTQERLVMATMLLESLIMAESDDEADWRNLSLAAFEAEWDNPEDAIYDDWRNLYGVPAR